MFVRVKKKDKSFKKNLVTSIFDYWLRRIIEWHLGKFRDLMPWNHIVRRTLLFSWKEQYCRLQGLGTALYWIVSSNPHNNFLKRWYLHFSDEETEVLWGCSQSIATIWTCVFSRSVLDYLYIEFSLESIREPLTGIKRGMTQSELCFKKIILTADWRVIRRRGESESGCKENH